jgi:hypothetical protein
LTSAENLGNTVSIIDGEPSRGTREGCAMLLPLVTEFDVALGRTAQPNE